ncbi:MAG TPA: glycerol-3-phosphate 1-O-acyltransferase PlsY [Xanthobacteraceae bacterium]|nr:glycerol-3-phosphate 1-O-acyltransferase PlsY [Xanthobacteraceae bacterium]
MLHPIDWSLAPAYADAAAFVFGYLCGSIPFGILLTRLAGGPDLRAIGSGNIGATNVLRTGRRGLAAATLIGDMLKGTAAIVLTNYFLGREFAIVAAVAAFLGHLFPVWLRFRGGKGVATYIGLLLGLAWPTAILFCAIWLTTVALTRYSSLAALIASAAAPAFLLWRGDAADALVFLLLSAILWIMHRANIARLLRGTESKIGAPSPTAGDP